MAGVRKQESGQRNGRTVQTQGHRGAGGKRPPDPERAEAMPESALPSGGVQAGSQTAASRALSECDNCKIF